MWLRSDVSFGRAAMFAVGLSLLCLVAGCTASADGDGTPGVDGGEASPEENPPVELSPDNGDEATDSATSEATAQAGSGLSLYVGAGAKVYRFDLDGGGWTTVGVGGSPVLVDRDWLITYAASGTGARALPLTDPDGDPVDLGRGDVARGPAAPSGHVWQGSSDPGEWPRYRLREISTGEELFALPASLSPTGAFDPRVIGEPVTGIFLFKEGEIERVSDDRLLAVGDEHLLTRSCSTPAQCVTRWLDRATGSPVVRPVPEQPAENYVVSANGRLVAGLRSARPSWIFDTESEEYVIEDVHLSADLPGRPFSLAPDGSIVAIVSDGGVAVHTVDTGETTVVELAPGTGKAETVLLAWAPGTDPEADERPLLSDFSSADAAVAEEILPADAAFDESAWTGRQLEPGQPLPGIDTGLTLLSGDRNDLHRLDFRSGAREQWDGVGVPVRRVGDWIVYSGEGTIKAARGQSPNDVIEVLPDPIYFNIGTAANLARPGQQPGQVWLNSFTDEDPGSAWRLVDLNRSELLQTIPTARWQQFTILTGPGDPIQTSESGGVFEFSDSGYRRVLDGTLKAVSDTHVLVETCAEAGRCSYRWFSREDWSEVDWPPPPPPVLYGNLSGGSRVLDYRSYDGLAYIEVATGEPIHFQANLSIRDDVSSDGRYVTVTFKERLDRYVVVDLETHTFYVVPLELTAGSSMPVLIESN